MSQQSLGRECVRTAWRAVLPVFTVLAFACAVPARAADFPTPLELAGYQTIPDNETVSAYLVKLAEVSPVLETRMIGRSAKGRPISAVYLSKNPASAEGTGANADKLRILLLGAQHGTEPSGGEALQRLARDIALGHLARFLDRLDIVIVPISNPDGRDERRRTNGNGINLSTDFLVQTQPETRILTELLRRESPHVILDIHESAIYKRSSLGAQGFMTDVEAQFDVPNNPNVPGSLRRFALDRLLPAVLRKTSADGLLAGRYIGEITNIRQPITHGGLTLRNVRNYGSFIGPISMLLENRLDPPGTYPTPRNIKVRVEKQYLSIRSFLTVVTHHWQEIREVTKAAEIYMPRNVILDAEYVADPANSTITLPLYAIKKRDNGEIVVDRRIQKEFKYLSKVGETLSVPLPRAYAITRYQNVIGALLDRHKIKYSVLSEPRVVHGEFQFVDSVQRTPVPYGKIGKKLVVNFQRKAGKVELAVGDLWIDPIQPMGRLVPLMLDLRSSTSIYQDPAFMQHLGAGSVHYAIAVP